MKTAKVEVQGEVGYYESEQYKIEVLGSLCTIEYKLENIPEEIDFARLVQGATQIALQIKALIA
ncbi:hypothetical protein [Klebsiella pneumoniae]|jgi:hypothetical protein